MKRTGTDDELDLGAHAMARDSGRCGSLVLRWAARYADCAALAEQERKLISERNRAAAASRMLKGHQFGLQTVSKAEQRRISALGKAARPQDQGCIGEGRGLLHIALRKLYGATSSGVKRSSHPLGPRPGRREPA
jgi:hypothetical protein